MEKFNKLKKIAEKEGIYSDEFYEINKKLRQIKYKILNTEMGVKPSHHSILFRLFWAKSIGESVFYKSFKDDYEFLLKNGFSVLENTKTKQKTVKITNKGLETLNFLNN
jgi:hypothetical protein